MTFYVERGHIDILSQIQANILDHEVPLSDILRKAKVLASELGSDELTLWVDQELNGYTEPGTLPDYRILHTSVSGTWTNGYWMVHNRGVPLLSIKDEDLRKHLTTFSVPQGIRTVEQFTRLPQDRHFMVAPDTTTYVNSQVGEGGYGYSQLHYAVGPHNFEQILDTVRNRLLDFVLKLGKRWDPGEPPPAHEVVGELVSIVIYNNPQGGNVSVFDQRGQHIQYQFNSAGDININSIDSVDRIVAELGKFRAEIDKAKVGNAITEDIAIQAQYHLLEASREVASKKPDRSAILQAISKTTGLLKSTAALTGLVTALTKLSEVVKDLIH